MSESVLISACLLGSPCRFDGQSRPVLQARALADKVHLVPFCPEIYGGLPTPRTPCEIRGESVVSAQGTDCTQAYAAGAREALRLAQLTGCRYAVLKEKSPSCGSGLVYDGTFSRTLKKGDGITAALLKKNGIKVFGESQINQLLSQLDS